MMMGYHAPAPAPPTTTTTPMMTAGFAPPKAGGSPLGSRLVKLGVGWGLPRDSSIDLDLACFVFDGVGQLLDVVYFRQLVSIDGAINHSGDNLTGEGDGDDEQILFDLPRVRPDAHHLVIAVTCQTPGVTLSGVNAAHIRVFIPKPTPRSNDGDVLFHYPLRELPRRGNFSSFIMGIINRDASVPGGGGGGWLFKQLSTPSRQKGLDKLLVDVTQALEAVIPPELLARRNAMRDRRVDLTKGTDIGVHVTRVRMGLGWDLAHGVNMDLDAWCYMRDARHQKVETVYYHKLRSDDGSVVHSGDNRTGAGSGDDEIITVNLSRVHRRVKFIYFVVKVYGAGNTFRRVRNPYVRMVDLSSGGGRMGGKEICKFKCKDVAASSNALVVGKLYRVIGSTWRFQALGMGSYQEKIHERLHTFTASPVGRSAAIASSSRTVVAPRPAHHAPRVGFSMAGEWKLSVLEGRGLAPRDASGTSDPYFRLKWGAMKKKSKVG